MNLLSNFIVINKIRIEILNIHRNKISINVKYLQFYC